MIDNSTDKGYITVVVKQEDDGIHLCKVEFPRGADEASFYVNYENGEIFINSSDQKKTIGTYETVLSSPYGAKVFDFPSNRLIGFVGNEFIYFYKGDDANRILEGDCLAYYSEAGSITLPGSSPLDYWGLINGSEIGGAAAFIALFYNYRIISIFRDFFEMDYNSFMNKHPFTLLL